MDSSTTPTALSWARVPDEIRKEIAKYLNPGDRARLRLVCQAFNRFFATTSYEHILFFDLPRELSVMLQLYNSTPKVHRDAVKSFKVIIISIRTQSSEDFSWEAAADYPLVGHTRDHLLVPNLVDALTSTQRHRFIDLDLEGLNAIEVQAFVGRLEHRPPWEHCKVLRLKGKDDLAHLVERARCPNLVGLHIHESVDSIFFEEAKLNRSHLSRLHLRASEGIDFGVFPTLQPADLAEIACFFPALEWLIIENDKVKHFRYNWHDPANQWPDCLEKIKPYLRGFPELRRLAFDDEPGLTYEYTDEEVEFYTNVLRDLARELPRTEIIYLRITWPEYYELRRDGTLTAQGELPVIRKRVDDPERGRSFWPVGIRSVKD